MIIHSFNSKSIYINKVKEKDFHFMKSVFMVKLMQGDFSLNKGYFIARRVIYVEGL